MPDTIYALASARGRAGIAVIRLSGPHALCAARVLGGDLPHPRQAGLRLLRAGGEVLDQALVLTFPGPASFTGEDVVELHLHGSQAVIDGTLRALGTQPGLRLANAGEFTRRALENGRMDLAQVEGLADLIDSETEAQRRQALRLMQGELSAKTAVWRKDLMRAAALLEATIDFADEDVPVDVTPEVNALLLGLSGALRAELAGTDAAERIRDGFEVAIIGLPNVGKSTLLNKLAGRDVAITSDIAGTTRDVLELRLNLNGLAVTMLDTAGLRDSTDQIESIGVERARSRANGADLRIFLLTSDSDLAGLGVALQADDLIYQAKGDVSAGAWPAISGKTGLGIDTLLAQVSTVLSQRAAGAGSAVRERHRIAMQSALDALCAAQAQLSYGLLNADLAAEELRIAARALDSLIGKVDVEQLLDVIFSSFCIGK